MKVFTSRSIPVAYAAILSLGLSPSGAWCQTTPPPNIILIVADDLGPIEFPIFNPPIQWEKPSNPGTTSTNRPDDFLKEKTRRLPAYNRLAARMFADRTTGNLGTDATGETIVPIDRNPGSFTYLDQTSSNCDGAGPTPAGCDYARDVLRGFGGLAELAREGVVFTRMYSSAARCTPTRASILTGRYTTRTGVRDNGNDLDPKYVTIGEFLKQGCDDQFGEPVCLQEDGSLAPCTCVLSGAEWNGKCNEWKLPCYVTGMIGKWHLGTIRRKNHQGPWRQGFDEYFGYKGKFMKPNGRRELVCSPTPFDGTHPGSCEDSGQTCTNNGVCGPNEECLRRPLYIGRDPTKRSCAGREDDIEKNVDCCTAESHGSDLYRLKKKDLRDPSKQYQGARKSTTWPCNDDGETATTGCAFSTRYFRDRAKDFISRHVSDVQSGHPFFLIINFHEPHIPNNPPLRTEQHYKTPRSGTPNETRPKEPSKKPTQSWAAIEELDAAIGQILDHLNGVCDGASSAEKRGAQCTNSADCDGGMCVNLRQNTVVLFTSDQGRAGSGWGEPMLRKGKQTVYEQGIRVGLLARGPGFDAGSGGQARVLNADVIGSHVDLFSTIADLAGYDEIEPAEGGDPVSYLNEGQVRVDEDPAPGPTKDDDTRVDGRSFLRALESAVSARDFIFAEALPRGDAATIVTREGFYTNNSNPSLSAAEKVCGYLDVATYSEADPSLVENNGIARTVRGGSCTPCGEQSAGFCDDKPCNILGKVCIPTNDDACTDDDEQTQTECHIERYPRCLSDDDCTQSKCVSVETKLCNACVPASWKLRGIEQSDPEQPIQPVALYDIGSNPEEMGDLENDSTTTPVNCLNESALAAVKGDLACRLRKWLECTKDPAKKSEDCEAAPVPCN